MGQVLQVSGVLVRDPLTRPLLQPEAEILGRRSREIMVGRERSGLA
jgi:hypothetical protein